MNIALPSNPADRKAIMDCMREISSSYTRIEGERDFVKEAIKECAEKYNLPKAHLRKLSRYMHAGNFDEEAGKFEELATLYETLTNGGTAQEESNDSEQG